MTDRRVRNISNKESLETKESCTFFSNYVHCKNIILLGDPGAGKSHLFEHFAEKFDGNYQKARQFIYTPQSKGGNYYIDAIDEIRGGQGGHDVISLILQRLFEIEPNQVRISCRVADWLGETDCEALAPYFDKCGGYIVLALQQLTDEESQLILKSQGIENPHFFIQNARDRGLVGLLGNPQNLILLAQVVNSGEWPETRKDLFKIATRLLLSEKNKNHGHLEHGKFITDELLSPAGAICSAHLISDVDGISLHDSNATSLLPSYRSISEIYPNLGLDKIRAALGRRIFTANMAEDGSVTYIHRTVAEYLGAKWLAELILAGLPIKRLQSLISIDGYPATELRGLHAWLPILLPNESGIFIHADPYGVLAYGDAASLNLSSKKTLLKVLNTLSEEDPRFYHGHEIPTTLGKIFTVDMLLDIKEILKSETNGLRSLVLYSLSRKNPYFDLQDELLNIVRNRNLPHIDRMNAIDSLLQIANSGENQVVLVYKNYLGNEASEIDIRAEIISKLYQNNFTPKDISNLINISLILKEKLSIGFLRSLPKFIILSDVEKVLDGCLFEEEVKLPILWENALEVLRVFDNLFLLVLKDMQGISEEKIWTWLKARDRIKDISQYAVNELLQQELKHQSSLIKRVIKVAIDQIKIDGNEYYFMHRLNEIILHSIDESSFFEILINRVLSAKDVEEKHKFLYIFVFSNTINRKNVLVERIHKLYSHANSYPFLKESREMICVCSIDDCRGEYSRDKIARNKTREINLAETRANFEKQKDSILNGTNLELIRYIGKVYFSCIPGLDKNLTPRERLIKLLGEKNSCIALEGLVAYINGDNLPSFKLILNVCLENKTDSIWYAIIAGLNEFWRRSQDVSTIPKSLLRIGLTVDLILPTFFYEERASYLLKPGWRIAALNKQPDFVFSIYLEIAISSLQNGDLYIYGLQELLCSSMFISYQKIIHLELLKNSYATNKFNLMSILSSAICQKEINNEVLAIIRESISKETGVEKKEVWIITAYLISAGEFEDILTEWINVHPNAIWTLRDMLNSCDNERNTKASLALNIKQMEFIITTVAKESPNCYPKESAWEGSNNKWNGSEFVRNLIYRISANPSETASAALRRLEKNEFMTTYCNDIKHAAANQNIIRRNEEYQQPDWHHTLQTLSNGSPANVVDLHALLLERLDDISKKIAFSNSDIYKDFWNTDERGEIDTPKAEENCRDKLLYFIKSDLTPLKVIAEPEGHMVIDCRADIVAMLPNIKVPIEIKCDHHRDVWVAAENQLERLYARDYESQGYGIYVVFWFGEKRGNKRIPKLKKSMIKPSSAKEMQEMLKSTIPIEKQNTIAVVVIDVSKPKK